MTDEQLRTLAQAWRLSAAHIRGSHPNDPDRCHPDTLEECADQLEELIAGTAVHFSHLHRRRMYRRRPECQARRASDGHKCRLHAGHAGVHVAVSSNRGRETFDGDWEGVAEAAAERV